MRSDASIAFVPIGGNQSLIGADGVAIPSVNTIDLLGQGVGTAPVNIIGTATVFGTDFGIGSDRPLLDIVIGTALVTGNSATLTIALQGAPDAGVGSGYQPGTWQTLVESPAITAAQGAANTKVARFDWPPVFPSGSLVRYMRLLFSPAASTHFTAGTIASAIVTMARDDQGNKYAAKNFSIS